jgi:hypothetical protein
MYASSVLAIYTRDAFSKKFDAIGSGVLLAHRERRYIVSAAHVAEKMVGSEAFMAFEGTFFRVGLAAYTSNFELYGRRADDPLDLAVFPIPATDEEKFAAVRFITYPDYLAGARSRSGIYQAVGFPSARNTQLVNRTARLPGAFRSEALRCTVFELGAGVFPYRNFSGDTHIATALPATGVRQGGTQKIQVPKLNGMSGGLLQQVDAYNPATDGFDLAYPAGIILEKAVEKKMFLSLRLEHVFEFIEIHRDYLI